MSPQEYCRDKTAQAGSSFTAAFRLLPAERRESMEALYAFCREVDDIADDCSDPSVAAIKLAWWRNEIDVIARGESQHPVGRALHAALIKHDLPQNDLYAVIDGVSRDLHIRTMPSWEELDAYCDRVAGAVGRLSSRVFGASSPEVDAYASELGLALQYTNILRDVGGDARQGRIYLPDPLLMSHGLSHEDILLRRPSGGLTEALSELARRAHDRYDRALLLLPAQARAAQRPGLVMAAVYRDLLRTIEQSDFDVLNQRISLGPARKAWVAGRAALGLLPR
ncbi:MAG: squalene synthase HpnD [Betaproteobacteria bacterium]|nr:squalene synthase HpnD [Betaproteobacteria bacterium]NBT74468.1 squalene synthase HpnD [Betaproteobacteria bacterium]NBY13788.1 squalene synthase HpnD [Betaproteobacteria bacterium]NCA15511.1 squalene synthase HpnD [Betaproteobacteria bacterium]